MKNRIVDFFPHSTIAESNIFYYNKNSRTGRIYNESGFTDYYAWIPNEGLPPFIDSDNDGTIDIRELGFYSLQTLNFSNSSDLSSGQGSFDRPDYNGTAPTSVSIDSNIRFSEIPPLFNNTGVDLSFVSEFDCEVIGLDGSRSILSKGSVITLKDGDSLINIPTDSDEDGMPDFLDLYPNNPNRVSGTDTDSDGIDDEFDTDDDNDGALDVNDNYPLNPNRSSGNDSDGDGTDDEFDTDDDNDGVLDVNDNYPLNPNRASGTDVDGDGIDDEFDSDNTDGPLAKTSSAFFVYRYWSKSNAVLTGFARAPEDVIGAGGRAEQHVYLSKDANGVLTGNTFDFSGEALVYNLRSTSAETALGYSEIKLPYYGIAEALDVNQDGIIDQTQVDDVVYSHGYSIPNIKYAIPSNEISMEVVDSSKGSIDSNGLLTINHPNSSTGTVKVKFSFQGDSELKAAPDLIVAVSFSWLDSDGDGTNDFYDTDSTDGPLADKDGDGILNQDDLYPDDPTKTGLDKDLDGIDDAVDDDRDNDGYDDDVDVDPDNPYVFTGDSDNDGVDSTIDPDDTDPNVGVYTSTTSDPKLYYDYKYIRGSSLQTYSSYYRKNVVGTIPPEAQGCLMARIGTTTSANSGYATAYQYLTPRSTAYPSTYTTQGGHTGSRDDYDPYPTITGIPVETFFRVNIPKGSNHWNTLYSQEWNILPIPYFLNDGTIFAIPFEWKGYYPLYTTQAEAEARSPSGSAHSHTFGWDSGTHNSTSGLNWPYWKQETRNVTRTFWMPNGLTPATGTTPDRQYLTHHWHGNHPGLPVWSAVYPAGAENGASGYMSKNNGKAFEWIGPQSGNNLAINTATYNGVYADLLFPPAIKSESLTAIKEAIPVSVS